MEKSKSLKMLGTLAVAAALAVATSPAMAAAAPSGAPAYTCAGGEIPSGNYASITVTGLCSVAEDAVVTVDGNVDVAAGAMLDAQTVPSTITVGRNVTGAAGSLVGLGCQPRSATNPPNSAHDCFDEEGNPTDGVSDITVHGNVSITDADTVLLNGITVHGNVSLVGGGSFIPWAIKNNDIARNLTVSDVTAEWVGVMFNDVGGNVTLTDIWVTETHPGAEMAVYVVRNNVGRNLGCSGLGPNISWGFSPLRNVVGHKATGQCADGV